MLYVFEDYTLDTRRYELRRAGSWSPSTARSSRYSPISWPTRTRW